MLKIGSPAQTNPHPIPSENLKKKSLAELRIKNLSGPFSLEIVSSVGDVIRSFGVESTGSSLSLLLKVAVSFWYTQVETATAGRCANDISIQHMGILNYKRVYPHNLHNSSTFSRVRTEAVLFLNRIG